MESLSETLNDTTAERAQRQLDSLRAAAEVRLSELEAILADPSRGESLEGLILDLARIATQEARSAALKASVDARNDSDARVARAREEAQEVIDRERIVGGDLRRSLEQAREKIASLEQEHLTQVRTLRQDLEAEIQREQQAGARSEAAVNEARAQLEQERAAIANLRQALDAERQTTEDLRLQLERTGTEAAETRQTAEQARAAAASMAREKEEAWAAQEALTVGLARERETAAALLALNADLQQQLDAERFAHAELRRSRDEFEQQLASAVIGRDETSAGYEQLRRELEETRSEAEATRTTLEAAGARLEMLDTERLRADRSRKELEARVEALTAERDTLSTELQLLRMVAPKGAVAEKAAATSSPVTPPAAIAPPAAAAPPAPARSAAAPAQSAEEEWGPVRLAVRYAFRQPVTIQINGDEGLLVDLSVAGCQLVSASAVRPNQIIKVQLPTEESVIACTGKVMWARFEPRAASGSLGYRAGVQFTKPDQTALEGFITAARTAASA